MVTLLLLVGSIELRAGTSGRFAVRFRSLRTDSAIYTVEQGRPQERFTIMGNADIDGPTSEVARNVDLSLVLYPAVASDSCRSIANAAVQMAEDAKKNRNVVKELRTMTSMFMDRFAHLSFQLISVATRITQLTAKLCGPWGSPVGVEPQSAPPSDPPENANVYFTWFGSGTQTVDDSGGQPAKYTITSGAIVSPATYPIHCVLGY